MEWRLVEKWAAQGKLPSFRHLLQDGLRARLSSFADCLPDTVWTTLCYGVNPGKLEKYFYLQYDPDTAALRYAPDTELCGTPFWQHLRLAGKRVGVVDIPHLPFHEITNGFHLMGWGAHDNKSGAVASPSSLLSDVEARFGRYPVRDCERYNTSSRSRLRRDVLAGVQNQGELFRWLMQTRPWDVFLCSFSAAHCAGHHFWSDMDPDHPLHDPRDAQRLADTIEQTYRAIDREIGDMIRLAGPETRILVVAPHGMGPLSHGSWNLNEILDLLGFGRTGGPGRSMESDHRRGRINPWRIAKMVVPSRWQYAIKERLPKSIQDHLLFLWYAGGRRYRGRRAFSVPNNEVVGAIRIAVKGRDYGGLVEPGDDYRRLCLEITEALYELTDPVTGYRVVTKVMTLQDTFHGPFVGRLPDLAVLWNSTFCWESVHSPRFGTLRLSRQDKRTASHTPSSFLLAIGPGVPAGAELKGHCTLDIAPTVLESAGVAVPDHMDGSPLPFSFMR